ncbi:hypothetical protein WJ883_11810, partial [Coxiella burnetii]
GKTVFCGARGNMGRTFEEHGKNMGRTQAERVLWGRGEHGKNMGRTWVEHGKNMGGTWEEHRETREEHRATWEEHIPIHVNMGIWGDACALVHV